MVDFRLLNGKPRATLIQRFDGSALLLGPKGEKMEFEVGLRYVGRENAKSIAETLTAAKENTQNGPLCYPGGGDTFGFCLICRWLKKREREA